MALAAGICPAAGGLPHHPGFRQPPRRQSGDHGRQRGPAAGASVFAHPRPVADDFDQRPGLDADHAAVRPRAQYRRRRARRAVGHQRRRRPAARQPAQSADFPQDQSGRPGYHRAGGAVRHPAADAGQRIRRHHPGAADFADSGCRGCRHRRRAKALGARAGGSGQARRHGHEPGGRARRDRDHHRQPAHRQHQRRAAELRRLHQRPGSAGRALERHGAGLSQRRAGARARYRRRSRGPGERPHRRLGLCRRRGAAGKRRRERPRHDPVRAQAAGRQRDRYRRPHQGRAAAAAGSDTADGIGQHAGGPDAEHPRFGARRRDYADDHHRRRDPGDLRLPAAACRPP